MKFILILYVCSLVNGQCPGSSYLPYEFNNHLNCALAGYVYSHKALVELDPEIVNKEKLVVKFECKQLPSI
jgi:hypothetical protein